MAVPRARGALAGGRGAAALARAVAGPPAAAARDADGMGIPGPGGGAPRRVLVRPDPVRAVSVGAPLELGESARPFVGLENFGRVLRDPLVWISLRNTVLFTVQVP